MLLLIAELAAFFLFILVFGYVLPAGYFYYHYHVRTTREQEQLRIQDRRPTGQQIRREVRLSLVTINIWAVMATALFQLYLAGMTQIYLHFGDYPLIYLPISLFLCVFIHDTYFYWTHRFMHWRP